MTGNVTQAAFVVNAVAPGSKVSQETDSGKDFKKVMEKLNTDDNGVNAVRKTKVDNGKVRDNLKESTKESIDDKGNLSEADTENLVNDIKETVKKVLGMSDEEFEAAMAELGFVMADLLIPQNIAGFIAEFKEVSSLDMITDENLAALLTELTSSVQETVDEFAVSHKVTAEAVHEAVKEIMPEPENIPPDKTPEVIETPEEFSKVIENAVSAGNKDTVREKSDADEKLREIPAEPEKPADKSSNEDREIKVEIETETGKPVEEQWDKGSAETSDKETKNGRNGKHEENPAGAVLNGISDAVKNTSEIFTEMPVNGVNGVNIVRQIVDAVKVRITETVQSMEINLNPEHLGKLSLNVAARNGVITASITVQNEAVKAAIENQIMMLKEQLDSQGIKVQEVEVTVSSHAFDSNMENGGQENGNSRSNARRKFRGIEEISDEGITGNDTEDNLTDSNINLRA